MENYPDTVASPVEKHNKLQHRSESQRGYWRKLSGTISIIAGLVALGTATSFYNLFSPVEAQQPEAIEGPIEYLQELSGTKCYSFSLLERKSDLLQRHVAIASLGWTTSGIIRDNVMYLAEVAFSRVAKVPVGGYVENEKLALSYAESGEEVPVLAPWYLYPRYDERHRYAGYVLLDFMDDNRSQLIFVNESGSVDDVLATHGRLLTSEDGDQVVIADALRVVPVANGVVANADFYPKKEFEEKKNGDSYWNTFVYLDQGQQRESYIPLGIESDITRDELKELKEKFYGRDFTYMTEIEGTVYILIMQEQPWIGRVDLDNRKIERLSNFPSDLTVPDFDIRDETTNQFIPGTKRLFKVYTTIERSGSPIGLYSWKDRLFVLAKSPKLEKNGRTNWQLIEVSTSDGRDLGNRTTLPTTAEHIALVLGNEFFGVIEKGAIDMLDSMFPRNILYRPTRSAVLFPTGWLAGGSQTEEAPECQIIKVNYP